MTFDTGILMSECLDYLLNFSEIFDEKVLKCIAFIGPILTGSLTSSEVRQTDRQREILISNLLLHYNWLGCAPVYSLVGKEFNSPVWNAFSLTKTI